jgi:hypothetical protein
MIRTAILFWLVRFAARRLMKRAAKGSGHSYRVGW